jgi:hypothetical protein
VREVNPNLFPYEYISYDKLYNTNLLDRYIPSMVLLECGILKNFKNNNRTKSIFIGKTHKTRKKL